MREGQGDRRTEDLKQASHTSEPDAGLELTDHDLSHSQMLNQLCHPGALFFFIFVHFSHIVLSITQQHSNLFSL